MTANLAYFARNACITLTWTTTFLVSYLVFLIQAIFLRLMDALRKAFGISISDRSLESLDLEGVAKIIKEGKVKNIITAVGAGISTCK